MDSVNLYEVFLWELCEVFQESYTQKQLWMVVSIFLVKLKISKYSQEPGKHEVLLLAYLLVIWNEIFTMILPNYHAKNEALGTSSTDASNSSYVNYSITICTKKDIQYLKFWGN